MRQPKKNETRRVVCRLIRSAELHRFLLGKVMKKIKDREQEHNQLKKMLHEGLTFAQISERLRMTRSQVAGKVFRMQKFDKKMAEFTSRNKPARKRGSAPYRREGSSKSSAARS